MMQLEQGEAAYIDKFLNLNELPLSFRYYDQILNMIQERIKFDKKEYFGLNKAIAKVFEEQTPAH